MPGQTVLSNFWDSMLHGRAKPPWPQEPCLETSRRALRTAMLGLHRPCHAPASITLFHKHIALLNDNFDKKLELLTSLLDHPEMAGRYENPEEIPFYSDYLPPPLITLGNFPKILYPAAANVNVSKAIWDIYTNRLLPLFVTEGDDGNYASTTACDLTCLQALSRRIHYGRYVAEVKFQDAPEQYEPLIRAKDKDAIMKLLTDARVEDMVKKRVKKKATVFGQEVNSKGSVVDGKYKVDPQVVYHLYSEWVIPLTKVVEVEYLLRRLD